MNTRIALFSAGLFALSIALAPTVQADLDETARQLAGKYGHATSTEKVGNEGQTLTFERPGRIVVAKLAKGKCVSTTTTAIGNEFSGSEVLRILREQAQGQKWTHSKGVGDTWVREDGATAYIMPGSVDIVKSAAEGGDSHGIVEPPKLHLTPTSPVSVSPPIALPAPAK